MIKDRMELADTPPLRVVNLEQSQPDTGQACMLQSSHHDSAYAKSEDYANRPAYQTNCHQLVQPTDTSDTLLSWFSFHAPPNCHVAVLLLRVTLDLYR